VSGAHRGPSAPTLSSVTTRIARFVALVVATLTATAALVVVPAPSASAWPTGKIDIVRKGLGHGRGMGQWGAFGYAVNHNWSYIDILRHYYRGTGEGGVPNDVIDVQLMGFNNADTLVQQELGEIAVDGVALPPGTKAVRVRRTAGTTFAVDAGPDCGNFSAQNIAVGTGPFVIRPTNPQGDDHRHMLQACESNPTRFRWYRGQIIASNGAGAVNGTSTALDRITMNRVTLEEYLQGVVPRESPASWGNVGNGMEALKAQAVAARSYAWREDRPGPPRTCDTVTCQVYGGRAVSEGGTFTLLEAANTNAAVAATSGQVRVQNGQVVRTEFSASTGGSTTTVENGNPYGAVEDAGDSVCVPNTPGACNTLHRTEMQIDVATLENRFASGSLQGIEVVARDGRGEFGGRITNLKLHFSGGTKQFLGEEAVRGALGVGSTLVQFTSLGAFPYHVVTRSGHVYSYNGAVYHGSTAGMNLNAPIRDITEGPVGAGYWLLGEDGGVFSFNVPFYGSMGGQHLNKPVVGMEATTSRQGYWLVGGDGGIFTFGDARFFGSTGSMRLNAPVVGMSPTPTAGGYWLVATDGGIFTFGDATFFGSTGDMRLNQPVFAMAATPSGRGYWLVARDGGIFTFGDATFLGSLPGRGVREPAVKILPSPTGQGYLIVTAEGNVYGFGDAPAGGGPRADGAPAPSVGAGRVPQ
jgi:peptidoglycan hydrolase-like amidase